MGWGGAGPAWPQGQVGEAVPTHALVPSGISLIMWNALYTAEKVIIRWTLLTEACYFGVQFLGESGVGRAEAEGGGAALALGLQERAGTCQGSEEGTVAQDPGCRAGSVWSPAGARGHTSPLTSVPSLALLPQWSLPRWPRRASCPWGSCCSWPAACSSWSSASTTTTRSAGSPRKSSGAGTRPCLGRAPSSPLVPGRQEGPCSAPPPQAGRWHLLSLPGSPRRGNLWPFGFDMLAWGTAGPVHPIPHPTQ